MTKRSTILFTASLATLLTVFFPLPVARADIFEWEYINPANPALGKQPSATLTPDGAGVDAVSGAILGNRNLTKAYLIGAYLGLYPIYDEYGEVIDFIPAANLNGANLSQADLTGATLYGSTLINANLSQANLTNANLNAVVLTNANLSQANLTNAYLVSARLTNADLSQANLTGARFTDAFIFADLTGANLSGANLINANFAGEDWCGDNGCGTYSGANLTNANLSGADARGANLYLATLDGANANNLIQPDGHIAGLNLTAGKTLVVRDYDGYAGVGLLPIVVDQHLAMDATGVLHLVFDADPWNSTISFAPGISVTRGGALELTFTSDVNLASQVGRTIDLFDWTGVTPTGAFTVSSPYTWNLANLYTTGEVTLTAVPSLPGDFNHNGTVDAADYVVWRKGVGVAPTLANYNIWRSHFGQPGGSGSGAATNATVPEPAMLMMSILAATGLCLQRRRAA